MASVDQRNNSPSPNRGAFGSALSLIGAKISRGFAGSSSPREDDQSGHSDLPVLHNEERSQSRGRDAVLSTGRGGFGNIRTTSQSRDRPTSGPDDFSTTRGREPTANFSSTAIYSTGRGGAGNLRSPSREGGPGSAAPDTREKQVIEHYVSTHAEAPISTGRGGIGNIASRSRSRDPSHTLATGTGTGTGTSANVNVITTGRGGAGNVREGGELYEANATDELERKRYEGVHPDGLHSTGRGGFANITEQEEPSVERSNGHHHGSTGRGGAGNIIRN